MAEEKKDVIKEPKWKRVFNNMYGQPKSKQPQYSPKRVEHKKLSNKAKSIVNSSTSIAIIIVIKIFHMIVLIIYTKMILHVENVVMIDVIETQR
jgi:hypothetical protein